MSEFVAVAAKWAGCLKSRRSKRYNLAKVQARVSALKMRAFPRANRYLTPIATGAKWLSSSASVCSIPMGPEDVASLFYPRNTPKHVAR
ncbi:hypothetical protein HPB47_016119 [Ixodes persulcatus]|uniref:Uncharacterized protein n=1 Tax=Ixodes persulcatus TaxID=34615 RepID=A0AC60QRM9_IXOPE|nr:hypothetical protein HPB47_016119 [Ixodes persulcatus]